jgi:methyl-accepting chemotaxis protein
MKSTSSMKVSTRLSFGFGALALIGILIAIFSALQMRALTGSIGTLANDRMTKVAQLTEFMDNLNAIGRFSRNIVISDDLKFHETERKKITELRSANTDILAKLDKSVVLPKGVEYLKIIKDTRGNYNAAIDRAIDLAEKGNKAESGSLLIGEVRTLQNVIFKATNDLRTQQKELADQLAHEAANTASTSTTLMLGAAVLMLVISAIVGWLITRNLSNSLGAEPVVLSELAGRVADGDLSVQLQVRSGDTVSVMAAMARMQTSLLGIVSSVRAGSESVATASSQIAQGNNDLSQRTEEQASALEETAASMEELSSTVKQNADNARQANQLAQNASTVAIQGGEVVAKVVDTMKGINESSGKIADIISVIDGIAFQTNILALNAAVEAARAGEQGRGFAVVASEVRSLAGRSAEAAKEIKLLINASVERVEEGTVLVDQAGVTMTEVVGSIRRVTDIMGEISAASIEQSKGVAQIGEAIQQMDQVTQQNAALVEEMAAAAGSLKTQAQDLVGTVAMFKLEQSTVSLVSRSEPLISNNTLNASKRLSPASKNATKLKATLVPIVQDRAGTAPRVTNVNSAKANNEDWESF